MAIRVAHIGIGNAGRIALNHLISDPRFELTGVWVSSEAKVGKDAAELAGRDMPTGIAATSDLDALLADPGFANDLIPFAIASTCQKLEQVRCMEIADYATYDGSTVMFDVMGFGRTLDETPMLLQP